MAAKKKRKVHRLHEVRAEISNIELVKATASLTLSVYANKEKIGELQIGRGSLFWWGSKRKTPKRINWSRFASMMDKLAYGDS